MRESFVFHAEYIADLPDDYKPAFAMYAINYALNDEKPQLQEGTLEFSLWVKIARRIDQEREKYERVKEKRAAAGKKHSGNQYTKAEQVEQSEPAKVETVQNGTPRDKVEQKKSAAFVPPTVAEVDAYNKERRNGLDAQQFVDFYESKGWKVGAVKMKDWRAAVRTWEKRHAEERHKAGEMWGNENEIPDEILNIL